MTEYLGRDEILSADDRVYEAVSVPEWGGTVCVRSLSGAERDAFEESIVVRQRDKRGRVLGVETRLENIRARLAALTIVSGPGGPAVFSEQDVERLGEKSAAALQRVFDAAQRLSGISDSDVEELAKNYGSGPGDDSLSD